MISAHELKSKSAADDASRFVTYLLCAVVGGWDEIYLPPFNKVPGIASNVGTYCGGVGRCCPGFTVLEQLLSRHFSDVIQEANV